MKTKIELVDKVNFKATTGSGHEIQMDGPPEFGGENHGARPMEMLLVGMGGISIHFSVKGEGLTEKAVGKAVELSAEKYCSASIMLGKTAEIVHSFEIVE